VARPGAIVVRPGFWADDISRALNEAPQAGAIGGGNAADANLHRNSFSLAQSRLEDEESHIHGPLIK
jgi:hypothetical protein